jgi:hypothetical protein
MFTYTDRCDHETFPLASLRRSLSKAFGWLDRWLGRRLNHVIKISCALSPDLHGMLANLALESKAKMDSRFRGNDGGAAARALAVLLQMVDHRANQNITPA